jgi:hypothetical protein
VCPHVYGACVSGCVPWTTICWPQPSISTLCARPSGETKTGVLILLSGLSALNNIARLGARPVRTALFPIMRSASSCNSSATPESRTSTSMAGVRWVIIPVLVASAYSFAHLSMRTSVASMSGQPLIGGALPFTGSGR